MKYCNKCVTPETAETNIFGKDGTCSVCKQIDTKSEINWKNRSKDLDEIIQNYKDKFEYDCIVPFSGGKDSTFALWYLVKEINNLVSEDIWDTSQRASTSLRPYDGKQKGFTPSLRRINGFV